MAECKVEEIVLTEQTHNDTYFDVVNVPFCKFFIKRTFTKPNGGTFNLCGMHGSNLNFKTDNLITKDISSLSLILPNDDVRPLLMTITPNGGKPVVYYRSYAHVTTWLIYNKYIDESEDAKSDFVELLKETFKSFYKVELMLSEYLFINRIHNYDIYRYSVIRQKDYVTGYDRYILKQNRVHSIASITIDRIEQTFSRDISFTDDICFYFYGGDKSTILLMEMWDYEMCDIARRCFYYKRERLGSDHWIPVNGAEGSEKGMAFDKLKGILDEIVTKYDESPVTANFPRTDIIHFHDTYTLTEAGVRFKYDYNFYYYYIRNCLTQRVGRFFRIEGVSYDDQPQHIQIPNAPVTSVCLYFITLRMHHPVLISIGLYNRATGKTRKHLWYQAQEYGSDIWVRTDFNADPDRDTKKIEEKLKFEFEESRFERELILPWVFLVFIITLVIFGCCILSGLWVNLYWRFMRFLAYRRRNR